MRGIRIGLAALLTAACCALSAHQVSAAGAIRKINGYFPYDGRKVRVEIFRPAGNAQAPAVLVLHGASGVGNGWYVYPFAEALASHGLAAGVVRYYDGLGPRKGKSNPGIFTTRDSILKAATDYMLARDDTLPDSLGIYGMSLGGFHALSLAVQDPRIKSVASLGGGLSNHIPESSLKGLPPTLILHGSRDRVVPFDRALKLRAAMNRQGVDGHIKVYRNEGHSLSARAHGDAVETVARFLAARMSQPRMIAKAEDGGR